MPDHPFLNEMLRGWKTYQDKLVQTVSPLSKEQLAMQLSPELWPVMTLTAHIIAARVFWFHLVMKEGTEELKPLVAWDDEGEPFRSAQELVGGLEQTWAVIDAGLSRWTAADMAEEFPWPRAGRSQSYSRQWVIWHVLEHDIHHGGELSFALGANGIPAIDL